MAQKKTIETPGANSESLDQIDKAQEQVNNIQLKASNIANAITVNRSIIDNPDSLEDEKELAQLKLNALLDTQELINSTLSDADASLNAIKAQEQIKAATMKKTDMSKVTVSKKESKTVTGANVELTDQGYVIKPRKSAGVAE